MAQTRLGLGLSGFCGNLIAKEQWEQDIVSELPINEPSLLFNGHSFMKHSCIGITPDFVIYNMQ